MKMMMMMMMMMVGCYKYKPKYIQQSLSGYFLAAKWTNICTSLVMLGNGHSKLLL